MNMSLYSIVVPVYNSEQTIMMLYEQILDVFSNTIKKDFELILIDDSSKDNSFGVMEKLHKQDSRVRIIQLSSNFGQHCALMCGFMAAVGDFVITMDDDLQHPPDEIPKLVRELDSHDDLDVVIGTYESKKHNFIRKMGTALNKKLASLAYSKRINANLTSFRIMRIYIAKAISNMCVTSPRIGYLIFDTTNRIGYTSVKHNERLYGKSGYTFKRLINISLTNLYTNSVFPLIVVRNIGFFVSLGSVLGAIYYLIRYFYIGITIQGWTTLVLIIIFFSGLILFSLGIIGEYLMRIFLEAKKKPNYIIRREHR